MEIKTIDQLGPIQFKQLLDIYYQTSSTDLPEVKYMYFDYYHENAPELFFVVIQDDRVLGYVCGLNNTSDHYEQFDMHAYLDYFQKELILYPGHLHINVSPNVQGSGVGKALIEHFEMAMKKLGCIGLHIITLEGLENNHFYNKRGFCDVKVQIYQGKHLLLMGKIL